MRISVPHPADLLDHADYAARVAVEPLAPATRPLAMGLTLLTTDLAAMVVAVVACAGARLWLGGQIEPLVYWHLWPMLALWVFGAAAVKLYPGAPLNPPEEIRRVFLVTSTIYLMLGTMTFISHEAGVYSRAVFLAACPLSIALVLVFRAAARLALARTRWWGQSVVILGAGRVGRRVVKLLRRRPEMGLKPVAILDDRTHHRGQFAGVPIVGAVDRAPEITRAHRKLFAIVALSDIADRNTLEHLLNSEHSFRHVIVIPDLAGMSTLGVTAQDLGGLLGLELRQRLLDPGRMAIKRAADLLLIALAGPLVLLLTAAIALLIKLESRGPVFYGHVRIGRGRRNFKAWKFRTMVYDADARLRAELERSPALREEWDRKHKLEDDPRLTRVGKYLRRMSLDELPQLWNVLVGQMSLVGPRPIIEEETRRYGRHLGLYLRVRPGLTGLWQVSGRNDLTYAERVRLDVFYVRNWSVWLDIYLMASTFRAVVLAKGAY